MLVELGNKRPVERIGLDVVELGRGPAVTYMSIPDSFTGELDGDDGRKVTKAQADERVPHYGVDPGLDVSEALRDLGFGGMVSHLPGSEALVSVVKGWEAHSPDRPTWVWSDSEALSAQIAEVLGCPEGRPGDVEMTHWTQHGGYTLMPGVAPSSISPLNSNTDAGRDIRWRQQFGITSGAIGTATGSGATSLTDSGASWGTTAFVGCWVVAGNKYANIISHTGTVLTLDRWYDASNPGNTSAAATPSSTALYAILPGVAPAMFMGLSANTSAVVNGDTTLTAEITSAGGGLIRKVCPLAHTAGATTGTLTPVFTGNGSDSYPVTIGKIGVSPSILSTLPNTFLTLLGTTATISLSGDQLTVTDTVTI